jgi:CheY-like chemotaxis protein
MVGDALRGQGYAVIVARDGQDALEKVAAHGAPLHLLLTDVVMPRLGGLDLARRLRPEFPELCVILTSGYVHGGIGELAEFGSQVRAVAKPYTPGEMLAAVRELLDS